LQPRDDLLSTDLVAIDTHPPHVKIGNSFARKECGSDAIVISPDAGNWWQQAQFRQETLEFCH
jgi:hypothetical protein